MEKSSLGIRRLVLFLLVCFSVEVVMAHKHLHHSKALNQLRTIQRFYLGIVDTNWCFLWLLHC